MKQQTFSDIEYGGRARITKREEFLDALNKSYLGKNVVYPQSLYQLVS